MNRVRLRNPYEIPLYILSVLVNLLIIALILYGALFMGYLNALAGEPLSGPLVDVIQVAFVALLLLVPDEDVEPHVPLVQGVRPTQGVSHRAASSSAETSALASASASARTLSMYHLATAVASA